jgi:hypothetical protein
MFCSTNSYLFLRFKPITGHTKLSEIGWRRPRPDNCDRHRLCIEGGLATLTLGSFQGCSLFIQH